jgi:hypothetical protein
MARYLDGWPCVLYPGRAAIEWIASIVSRGGRDLCLPTRCVEFGCAHRVPVERADRNVNWTALGKLPPSSPVGGRGGCLYFGACGQEGLDSVSDPACQRAVQPSSLLAMQISIHLAQPSSLASWPSRHHARSPDIWLADCLDAPFLAAWRPSHQPSPIGRYLASEVVAFLCVSS